MPACIVCGGRDWRPLPDPLPARSITTAGRIVDQPLGKAQCTSCALVQRTGAGLLARTDFYEKRYSFYHRPGAERFDRGRYAAMAAWIAGVLPGAPGRVLDAGCGRGWMLQAMQAALPDSRFQGVEPSEEESENARRLGFEVVTSRVGSAWQADEAFDLVYATNVVEHTDSPVEFLAALGHLITPSGRIVITCPDATLPNQEMMFADQNFSLLPAHFEALASGAGLRLLEWRPPPGEVSLRDKQLIVLGRPEAGPPGLPPPAPPDAGSLYDRRCDYLNSWKRCERRLASACAASARAIHFGTSTWGFLLAGYCPAYWDLVTTCTIDGGTGQFLGKPVADTDELRVQAGDVVVLGVDPDKQASFARRFEPAGATCVTWADLIVR
ncbi:MAG: class I SAM-dependent methyltransferase [Acidimicrobiia bacterium]|nr:class I SAM-dependent methyltransferase [Acidimicrobiia bacterium]